MADFMKKAGPNPNTRKHFQDLFTVHLALYDHPKRIEWWKRIAALVAPLLEGRKCLLDAGCGTGGLMAALPAKLEKVGADFSPEGLEAAKRKRIPNTSFIEADLERFLPFERGEFDAAICTEVLEHLSQPLDVLRRIRRVTRGIVILAVPLGEEGKHDKYPNHINTFTEKSLSALAKEAGLVVRSCRPVLGNTLLLEAESEARPAPPSAAERRAARRAARKERRSPK